MLPGTMLVYAQARLLRFGIEWMVVAAVALGVVLVAPYAFPPQVFPIRPGVAIPSPRESTVQEWQAAHQANRDLTAIAIRAWQDDFEARNLPAHALPLMPTHSPPATPNRNFGRFHPTLEQQVAVSSHIVAGSVISLSYDFEAVTMTRGDEITTMVTLAVDEYLYGPESPDRLLTYVIRGGPFPMPENGVYISGKGFLDWTWELPAPGERLVVFIEQGTNSPSPSSGTYRIEFGRVRASDASSWPLSSMESSVPLAAFRAHLQELIARMKGQTP